MGSASSAASTSASVYAIIEARTAEHQEQEGPHDLDITANVSTKAETEFGPIEEERSYVMTLKLGVEQVRLPETEMVESEGIIQETVIKENTSASAARKGALGITGIMGVVLLFVGWVTSRPAVAGSTSWRQRLSRQSRSTRT